MSTPTPTPTIGLPGAPVSRKTVFDCTYNGVTLGLCDEVDPTKFKLMYAKITVGSLGDQNRVGSRFVGTDGTVSFKLRQLNQAQYAALCPWAPAGGNISMAPPLNSDMYVFSGPLVLHPRDMGSSTAEDLVFPNACPSTLPLPKRNGAGEDVLEVEFDIFPSRTALAANLSNISSGQIGQ